ncbi:hypothetical protein [Deinococcus sp.]|uniref:hypothetical protein n=1 Tax=Deinococcus sp. TaxID=47478 RepID=UPI0025C73C93|nr:hypothetical protein [Deinococcus sp.]
MTLRVLTAAVLLPVLIASCAPVASLLAARDEQGPSPRQAGPLTVGETWTVTGPIDGRSVTATISIPDLVPVASGTASVNERDRLDAFATGREGFSVAHYDPERRSVTFSWVATRNTTYTCEVTSLLSLPYQGRLTMQRGGQTVANGTCQANFSQ